MWHASDTASRLGCRRATKRAAVLLLTTCLVPGELAAADDAGHRLATDGRPLVWARNVAGEAGAPIRLDIEVVPPSDRQITSTYLLGLPAGARVTDTTHTVAAASEEAAIEVTRWNLPDLVITLQPEQVGTFVMRVAAMTEAVDGAVPQVVSSGFTVSAQRPDLDASGAALRVVARTLVALPPNPIPHVPAPKPAATVPPDTGPPKTVSSAAVSPEVLPPKAGPADAARAAASTPVQPDRPPMHPLPTAAPPVALVEPSAAALVGRAEDLIRRGDVSGARLVLERALNRNEPRAALLLAQTYDPNVLRTWRVRGLRPDPERAQLLYARAAGDKPAEATSVAAPPLQGLRPVAP